ncbi:MAG: EF-hand domain-containing protein [Candidatus Thiodiazotropha sp.]
MKNNILIPALLGGVMLSVGALAQQAMMFEDLDTNHNGAISKSEAASSDEVGKHFDEADSNGDGGISVDEYTAYINKGRLVPEEVEVPEPGAAPVMR